uniref:interaptin n=1 Tax=Erigeron canadensis TaxID=72917 RepID=UPI001CB897B7|nr:interaptin [Erigeron canadensis]
MSRVTKWKIEKAKVKVVFRLQFHATNIPQSGWEKLFISFIPTETGKASAKTSKANVRNGTCKWADPIYETTRLLLDSKSKQYDDKLYKLVVGMGTSRSSILGEATINLADYADASQPSVIALPLHGSDHGTILHVTVQLLTSKTGFREFEQQRDKGLQRESEPSAAKSLSELQIPDDLVNKSKTRTQIREETNIHEEYSDSQVTCDGSSNTSETYYVDKHDSPSAPEVESVKSRGSRSQTSPTEKMDGSDHAKVAQTSGSDHSLNSDLTIAYEENHTLRGSLEVAESSMSEFKLALTILQNHANEIGLDTHKITQELETEMASSQALVKEVTALKSECSKFKYDLKQLKEMKSSSKFMERKIEKPDRDWVKGICVVEDRIQEIQEKVLIGCRESDLSFLQSDLEVLLGSVQELKKGPVGSGSVVSFGDVPSLPYQELEIAKAERENLVKKMDQMECYYEALVQELEENQKRILGEFQDLRNEHSTCVYSISTCKAETESMRKEMNDLRLVNNELQKRSTTSESALKRARLNYSIAVSQLQKDLDMLSFQVLSMFETNQTVIKEAFTDTSQPSSKHLSGGDVLSDDLKKSLSFQEKLYKKVEEELGELCSANLQLDVYSGTLEETLVESSTHIQRTNKNLQELAEQLQLSNKSRVVLYEDVHALNGQNAYYLARCNDLHLQNQMLETDLGNVSNENFLLMEKITECEALLMDYKVYKSKHELVSTENQNLQKDMVSLKEELENLKSEVHELTLSKEALQKQRDMAELSLSSARSEIKNSVHDNQNLKKDMVSVREEAETLRFGIHELTLSKEVIQKERDTAELLLKAAQSKIKDTLHDNQKLQKDLMSAREELETLKSEIDDVKRKFKYGLHDMAAKMEFPNASLQKLQLQLDSVANKFKSSLENEERHLENSEMVLTHLSSLELELQKMSFEDKNFVEKIMGLDMMAEEFEKCKLMISELKNENKDLKMHVESKSQESIKLLSELDCLKECLRCLNDELDVEKGLKNKLEGMVECLTSELECQSSELGHMKQVASDREMENSRAVQLVAQHEESLEKLHRDRSVDFSLECQLAEMQKLVICEDLKLIFVRSQCEAQIEVLERKHLDAEARLNSIYENEARYVKQNETLITSLESLQLKLYNTEVRLNELIESKARWMEEKEKLSTTLESLKMEREASIAHNALEVGNLKDVLMKTEVEVARYKELEMKLHDTEARLNQCLENDARYIEEKGNLSMELESLRVKLKASIAHNADISESNNVLEQWKNKVGMLEVNLMEVNNQHAVELGQVKDMLAKSESEAAQYRELQKRLHDSEIKLSDCIASETRCVEENEELSRTVQSLKLELEASIAHYLEISESNKKHALEVDELKDMLTKSQAEVEQLQLKLQDTESSLKHCLENEALYTEENRNLIMELESLKLELEASHDHNAEILDSKNEHALEVGQLKEILTKLEAKVGQYSKLETKLLDTESRLNHCLENEVRYIEENKNLETDLGSLRSELEVSIAQNAEISESNNEHALEIGRLEDMLIQSKEEVDQLKELKTKLLDTKEKLDHQISSEARYIEENESLRSELDAVIAQNADLSSSKNMLMVELKQYKNNRTNLENNNPTEVDGMLVSRAESEIVLVVLKARLDEQNDELSKLEKKCNELASKLSDQILKTEEFKNLSIYLKELKKSGDVAREKKDTEGPSESLRLAFIKEQYQTKVQDLQQQLSVSKRHNEEMLFKLQDALDEIESRKKSESSQLKRIEELEAEVQSASSDKPDNDRIQAELECALLSLECCKEEKEKLVALLQECEDEKSKITVELSLIKEQHAPKEENDNMGANGSVDSVNPINARTIQEVTERAYEHEENSFNNNSKQLTVVNDQFRTQHLRSCMEQLDEELEKMKNDNSLLPLTSYDPSFQDLQRELEQLNQANEELGSIYPQFVDFPGDGNALERVLALEIELAEALRTKKNSSIQFQSSFLKQHSDEEAVFKSFRDINELIKDMLEIKGKYVNVESELKEMHDRYSQLSLQFAEVEGERQKLLMTLKNVRSSRNLLRLNRSSVAALENHSL